MISYLFKFLRWIVEKFATAALIVGLGLLAFGLWIFLKDKVDFDQWRQETARTISGERKQTQAALDDVLKRMDRISTEIRAEQDRAALADRALANLKELDSTWDRYVGNPEQQKANAEQIVKTTATRTELTKKIEQLRTQFTRATWERDGLQLALGKIDERLKSIEDQQSKALHYFERTWNHPIGRGWLTLPVSTWVFIFLGLYFFGPTAGKVGMYYFIAPTIARGRAVQLDPAASALPEVSESCAAYDLALQPGERLWVKEKFLQASDEGLKRKTRYLLDWRIPFTCFATGLVELIEMHNRAADDQGKQRLTLSNQGNPHSELAVVTLREDSALILRPSFLIGVVVPEGQKLRLRRRWQLFRWQAWVTLQFRFFEFSGPCRLVIAGSRGVRVEDLSTRDTPGLPARRTNQDATIGFTPNLQYRPARAETFWSYYRGMNPLFDDLFVGRGIFLCQQVAVEGDAKKARKFWSNVWGGAMKAFGV